MISWTQWHDNDRMCCAVILAHRIAEYIISNTYALIALMTRPSLYVLLTETSISQSFVVINNSMSPKVESFLSHAEMLCQDNNDINVFREKK